MRTISIPGGSAVVREPSEMTERQRRLIRRSLFQVLGGTDVSNLDDPENLSVKLTPQLGAQMFEMRDAAIVAALASWTLDGPLPTLETVQDLPAELYDRLSAETAGVLDGIMVDFSPTPDKNSPTPGSSVSGGPLKAEETPTPTFQISGVNTSTASSTT